MHKLSASTEIQLSGKVLKQLHAALCECFTTRKQLAQFVRYELDEKLDEVASDGNLSDTIFDLIAWTEVNGKAEELLVKALNEYPNNPILKICAENSKTAKTDLPSPTLETVELVLNTSFDDFTEDKQKFFLSAIGMLLRTETDIHIINIKSGSVRLTLALSADNATKLKNLFDEGKLDYLGVVQMKPSFSGSDATPDTETIYVQGSPSSSTTRGVIVGGKYGDKIRGIVKWFNEEKGFGFIARPEGGKNIFVHKSALQGTPTLWDGDTVEFSVQEGPKGLSAVNVEVVNR